MISIVPCSAGTTAGEISTICTVFCRPALTTTDHRWLMPSLSCFYPQPGGACRTAGLSRGSSPGLRQLIARGPMAALYRHNDLFAVRDNNLFQDTSGERLQGTPPPDRRGFLP